MKFDVDPEWPLEPGQVIHPSQKKPLVGDYDLLGVIDPDAPLIPGSMGGIPGPFGQLVLKPVFCQEHTDLQNSHEEKPRRLLLPLWAPIEILR